ncbi:hypothetical protein [Chlamydiifrater phoenicopteri]|uniref:hypothetical protein n=1 Tax=Chlamydiifrater phoenicopteri TaxID=2681469 RepID=UPI001BCAF380|nr:hypothetical protein [Chlamydiifrater phoenicopteri]
MVEVSSLKLQESPVCPLLLEEDLVSFRVRVPLPERSGAKKLSYIVRDLVLVSSYLMVLLASAMIISGVFFLGMWASVGISAILTTILVGLFVWALCRYFKAYCAGSRKDAESIAQQ